MSDTPRTDVAEHNMGSVAEPHYVVDVEVARDLERELVAARAQMLLPATEYICKCGICVTPHRCKTDMEF